MYALLRTRWSRRSARTAALLIIVMALGALEAAAQSATATLSGSVVDETNAVVPQVSVSALNVNTRLQREARSDAQGAFTFPFLPPGTYVVRAERQGFTPVQLTDIVLNVNDHAVVKVQLKVETLGESVSVSAEASGLRVSPSVGTVVDRQFVENLPLNGRSLQSLITLTPGVVTVPSNANYSGGFSINGQRATANYFTIDGVSANVSNNMGYINGPSNSGSLPALTTFGGTNSLVSIDALEEFQVQTSTFAAEFGRMPGGQISMVTRSGTNAFRGSASWYVRNEAFDANDWFANRAQQDKAPLRQHDFGGVLGGPVVLPGYDGHNRTFFFVSYEGLRLRLPQFGLTNVPTVALRQSAPAAVQPILNAFPLPNGRDLGNGFAEFSSAYATNHRLNATSVRVDHAIGSSVTLFGRYNVAPSHQRQAILNNLSNVTFTDLETSTATFGTTAILSSRIVNEFRANYSPNTGGFGQLLNDFGGATPLAPDVLVPPQYVQSDKGYNNVAFLNIPGLSTTSTPYVSLNFSSSEQTQINLVDTLSISTGTHQFKLGVDYRRLMPRLRPREYLMYATFASLTDLNNAVASTGTIYNTGAEVRPRFNNFSAFAQDTWRPTSRLTLDYGVRWELNPSPTERDGILPYTVTQIDDLATMQLAPSGTRLWKTTYGNVAPRLGANYVLSDTPGSAMLVRGGFGMFHDIGNGSATVGYRGYGFGATQQLTNVRFPLDPVAVAPIPPNLAVPYADVTAFDPNLSLPYTLQWNVSVERELGRPQTLTVTYVGAKGRDQILQRRVDMRTINPLFAMVNILSNAGRSDYQSLQVQIQRRLSRGLQALASYTWSHSQDLGSTETTQYFGQDSFVYADADFDLRHNFNAAVTYDLPAPGPAHRAARMALGGWSLDSRITARSAFPINVTAGTRIDPVTGEQVGILADRIGSEPLYLDDPAAPGGWRLNPAAFATPAAGAQGSLGRNVVRAFGAWQIDLALRRQFRIAGRTTLQFRAEAFNLLNHPAFGAIQTDVTRANFGAATNMLGRQLGGLSPLYQIGGPRSLQLALKLQF